MFQQRLSERVDVSVYARLITNKAEISAKIINISEKGMGIRTTYSGFTSQEKITVILENGERYRGKIAWTAMEKIGVELESAIKDGILAAKLNSAKVCV